MEATTWVRVALTGLGPVGVAASRRGLVLTRLPDEATQGGRTGVTVGSGRAATGLDPGADTPPEVLAVLDAAEEALAAFYASWPVCPGEAVRERWVALRRLPVDLEGLPGFTRRVLELLRDVPPGRTVTYSELAAAAGSPRAARAVGVVMARNPLPLVIPCHRVIGSDGGLRGFGSGSTAEGLALKERLLRYEGWPPAVVGPRRGGLPGSSLWPQATGPKPATDEPNGNIVKAGA